MMHGHLNVALIDIFTKSHED